MPFDLRYQASRKWMEGEILAGQPIQDRGQVLSVDPDGNDHQMADRIESLLDGTDFLTPSNTVAVFDSGINPGLSFGPSEDALSPLDGPIVQAIGNSPELSEPTDDVEAVVRAWEGWIEAYKQLALTVIEELNANPPLAGRNTRGNSVHWGALVLDFGDGMKTHIDLDAGAEAIRDVRAAYAWKRAARHRFSPMSVSAGEEATTPSAEESQRWHATLDPGQRAGFLLRQAKRAYATSKAHDKAIRAASPDFDTEMARWAKEKGSDRLRLGIEDGYRMNARYLAERIAAEVPGFYAMPARSAADSWTLTAASPSESALRLRRCVEAAIRRYAPSSLEGPPHVEIVIVKKPPHDIYEPEGSLEGRIAHVGAGLPSRRGWPWTLSGGKIIGSSPVPFEAVVVWNWLGRFHLIGPVADEDGAGPAGIWVLPNPEHFSEDGSVAPQDPDAPLPDRARRKPPELNRDDDIPF